MSYENDHPTSNWHNPLKPWACTLGEGLATAPAADFHAECRACVLAAGVAIHTDAPAGNATSYNLSGETTGLVGAAWYEKYRERHGLPPLPERAS